MIIIHEGVPGAGKSYDAVRKILEALKKGRRVYTNIDGMDRPECLEYIASYVGATRDSLSDYLIFIEKGHIQNFWDYTDSGSLIVIDEAQLYFNSRDFTKQANREFADWASTHRHHGYDLILISQRAERIDTAVRSLAEFKYRYRKLTFLGSMFSQGFIVYNFIGDDDRHMSFAKRSYDKQIFPAYNSYVGDVSEKKFHKTPNVFKHPIFFSIPLIFAAFLYFASTSHIFSNPLDVTEAEATERLPLKSSPFMLSHVQTPATAGAGQVVAEVEPIEEGDPLQLFNVSAFIEKNGHKYLMVDGVLIYQYENYDDFNMVVAIRRSKLPAALRLKLASSEKVEINPSSI